MLQQLQSKQTMILSLRPSLSFSNSNLTKRRKHPPDKKGENLFPTFPMDGLTNSDLDSTATTVAQEE
jgi:hypothetical protein